MQKCYVIAALPPSYEGRGGGEIRTHEAFRPSGFQDRRIQPLCHPSERKSRSRELCHCFKLEQGGSSSPLLDVKRWRRSRIYFGIARGAAGSTKDSSTS